LILLIFPKNLVEGDQCEGNFYDNPQLSAVCDPKLGLICNSETKRCYESPTLGLVCSSFKFKRCIDDNSDEE